MALDTRVVNALIWMSAAQPYTSLVRFDRQDQFDRDPYGRDLRRSQTSHHCRASLVCRAEGKPPLRDESYRPYQPPHESVRATSAQVFSSSSPIAARCRNAATPFVLLDRRRQYRDRITAWAVHPRHAG